ncbi:common plant regulatory factor 1-like protein [Trifolium pratense]|uniref:Common plant regulatory factor 1-like protein n=1 Tax=Trifolium pratense TaxID=57577 RepID=A0A2K3NQ83_TRIPR|nr:common plant regulatory factor 1-like isoform X2 [Trifolium pratense]XP_045789651.1 common plant regulatory factor 1-like isoform X2 [Trifolium pratense]PNY05199.1 common plant regulatory factor 1-like protein [Trifolium pratense]
MGNSEDGKSIKIEKPSSPVTTDQINQTNQHNIHVYPDWAAMQAYYGQRVNIPPYFNSTVASGHAPHPYMWGPPQPMVHPYGPPYASFYPHGGVYTHPAVAVGPNSHGQGIPSSPAAGTPSSIETPTKSSGNTDHGLMKKLKGFDGLAMSIGNGNAESAERGAENRLSRSVDTEGSSDGSDGNTTGTNGTRKRSRDGTPTTTDGEGKTEMQDSPVSKENAAFKKTLSVAPASVAEKIVGPILSSGMTTALELRNPSTISAAAAQPCGVLPPEVWMQNERELKREKRKQSNRESARRSRLRKQAEAEELARRVDALTSENLLLKSEMNELAQNSEKLKMENATLKEKLKNTQLGQTEEIILNNIDNRATPVSTENLLSRVNNSNSDDRTAEEENGFCENKPNSGAKLHQLLDTNPRANAVAAS